MLYMLTGALMTTFASVHVTCDAAALASCINSLWLTSAATNQVWHDAVASYLI